MITVTIFYLTKYLIAYHYRETKKLHFDHTINKIDDDSVNNEMSFFVKKTTFASNNNLFMKT